MNRRAAHLIAFAVFVDALVGMGAAGLYAVNGWDAGEWGRATAGFVMELCLLPLALAAATFWAES